MPPIRILVVDESLLIRKVVSDTLKSDPAFEVAGTAGDAELALFSIAAQQPDLVVLGITMPVGNGLETRADLGKDFPRVRVVTFNSATIPIDSGSLTLTIAAIHRDLIPKIKALFDVRP